jgi:hypothetical protein
MEIIADDEGFTAFVILVEDERDPEDHVIELEQNTYASMSADGVLVGLDLMNTRLFGVPFDEAAAERAVAWAREQLELGTAS